jgi:hypothetical protein
VPQCPIAGDATASSSDLVRTNTSCCSKLGKKNVTKQRCSALLENQTQLTVFINLMPAHELCAVCPTEVNGYITDCIEYITQWLENDEKRHYHSEH